MNVAIDTRWIFPQISGIGAHTRNLVQHLLQLDTENRYWLIFNNTECRETLMARLGDTAARVHTIDVEYGIFSIRNQLLLGPRLAAERIDLYHSTNYMIPLAPFPRQRPGRLQCVVTIHDVIPLVFPDHAPRSRKSRLFPLYRWLMKEIARRADAIIAVSRTSRDDIIRHLCLPPSRTPCVHTVYNGIDPSFRKPVRPCEPRDPDRKRTILYVGRFDPYKNVTTLIEALAELRQRVSFTIRLRLVGQPDPRYPEPMRRAAELGLDDAVEWTGYLEDDALVDAYRTADLLVHPSRYEGFGLQVAEAMSAGLPVVCSNAASLREVAGDAALMCDPDDSNAFARNMERVLTERDLAGALVHRGYKQSARFSWETAARQTLAVYRKTAETKRG